MLRIFTTIVLCWMVSAVSLRFQVDCGAKLIDPAETEVEEVTTGSSVNVTCTSKPSFTADEVGLLQEGKGFFFAIWLCNSSNEYCRTQFNKWQTPGSSLSGTYRHVNLSSVHELSTYHMFHATEEQNTNYYCASYAYAAPSVCLDVGTPVSVNILLNVKDGRRASASAVASNTNVEIGSTFNITCNASGFPSPSTTWYKDKKILGQRDRVFIVHEAKADNAGNYYCIANNSEGSSSSNLVTVQVFSPLNWNIIYIYVSGGIGILFVLSLVVFFTVYRKRQSDGNCCQICICGRNNTVINGGTSTVNVYDVVPNDETT